MEQTPQKVPTIAPLSEGMVTRIIYGSYAGHTCIVKEPVPADTEGSSLVHVRIILHETVSRDVNSWETSTVAVMDHLIPLHDLGEHYAQNEDRVLFPDFCIDEEIVVTQPLWVGELNLTDTIGKVSHIDYINEPDYTGFVYDIKFEIRIAHAHGTDEVQYYTAYGIQSSYLEHLIKK